MSETPPSTPWYQFTLMGLICLVTVCAVGCAAYVWQGLLTFLPFLIVVTLAVSVASLEGKRHFCGLPIPRVNRYAAVFVEVVLIFVFIVMLSEWGQRERHATAFAAMEISQLDLATKAYKEKFGYYPPDFTDVEAVGRHIQRVSPRYIREGETHLETYERFVQDVKDHYEGLDPSQFDAASALVFWLGGLPATSVPNGPPAGFFADPKMPFKPGPSRIYPFFEFDLKRLVYQDETGWLRYYPTSKLQAPYVYFRARDGGYEGCCWPPADVPHPRPQIGYAVPYRDAVASMAGQPTWCNAMSFQIISAGLDGAFGQRPKGNPTAVEVSVGSDKNYTEAEYDNMTNFVSGTLEDAMLFE